MLIIDNEGIQGGKLTSETTFKFNWVYDSSGLGMRFDAAEDANFGTNNNLQFNVIFRNKQGGLSIKANNASTFRNTGTDNQGGEDVESARRKRTARRQLGFTSGAADLKICTCYPANCIATRNGQQLPAYTNVDSVTRGNVGIMDPGTVGGVACNYQIV